MLTSTRPAAVAAALLLVACGAPMPSLSPSTTERSAPIDRHSPTPRPPSALATAGPPIVVIPEGDSPAFDGRPRSETLDAGGVRLILDIGSSPHTPAFGTIVTVTLANRGPQRLDWWADGCGGNASVSGSTTATWRDSAVDARPELARYRDWLRKAIPSGPMGLQIDRPWTRLHRGAGCRRFGRQRRVEAGQSIRREFTWDGSAAARLGPPPNGPVSFTARIDHLKPERGDELPPLEVTLESWIVGGPPDEFLSPFEAIDAALADERLSSWLVTRPLDSTQQPVVEFDRDLGFWVVGAVFGGLDPILHAAFIDPMTREVFAVREQRVTF